MDPTIPRWETELTQINETALRIPSPSCDVQNQIEILLMLIIALVGLAGNGIVLWLLGFCMRRNAFSTYVLNLAAADFLFLCGQMIRSLLQLTSNFDLVYSIFNPVIVFPYLAGLSILSTISTERCLSVLWPIWYRCRRPRHMSAVVCALLWALSLLLSILGGYYCAFPFLGMGDHSWCQTTDFLSGSWLLFLFVVLSGSSLALLLRILCSPRKMQLTRLYVTILLAVLVFLLCGLPAGIKWFLVFWIQKKVDAFTCHFFEVSFILSAVNSSANPIIYFFVGSSKQCQNKKTLKLVLQRALQDTFEVDGCGVSLPRESLERSRSNLG
ncbi:mas-related G-protein coupled receptor member X2 [Carlito syrichta]|uniref:Mas-related G-protein coupled receptor member X2 n=1 Tax=Carlito syrichta TaxID=1868482 RepID=A0A1U7UTD4_CARSF|nr:mas-related G-protein coupled receptor member X2 [Carlito syrichta]